MRLFTKSAFKQALFCPASLYYYYDCEQYANQMNEDDFLQALAEGGQQAGDLAKVYYDVKPEADIKTLEYEPALEQTIELFKRDEVNIAEAAFRWKDCFVRADIIEKKGKHINLIEVKAKSWDNKDSFWGKTKRLENTTNKDFREYVYDIAFQKYVIQNYLGPEYTVTAYLMMADKTVVSDAPQGVNQYFRVVKKKGSEGRKDSVEIVRENGAETLRGFTHVLKPIYVDDICQKVIDGMTDEQEQKDEREGYMGGYKFKEFVDKMADLYVNHRQFKAKEIKLKGDCFKCPFQSNEKTPEMLDGKKECWKKAANFSENDFARPSVGDLWCGLSGGRSYKDELVKKGIYYLEGVSKKDICPKESRTTYPGLSPFERRLLQIGLATENEDLLAPFKDNLHDGVYLDVPALRSLMKPESADKGWRYPYHMIDFETTAVALPFYEGMHPYENVAFQFSHHIIHEDGTIEHAGQYINTEKHNFPNFEFARYLKEELEKDNGTIFRYATHENSILRSIYRQLEASQEEDRQELMSFIDSITYYGEGKSRVHGSRDMVDLLEIVKSYYYHPLMKGSNSIKAVLPAILNSSKAIKDKYSRPIYGKEIHSENYTPDEAIAWIKVGPDEKVENPYKHLDTIASFLEVSPEELEEFDTAKQMDETVAKQMGESVANGGAALAAYTKLQFADEVCTKALEKALLRYCELDTMSMVFIWEYFHEMTGA